MTEQQNLDPNLTPAEAITAFCAWLTTRGERISMSASDDCSPAAQAIREFLDFNDLGDCREGYENLFKMPPSKSVNLKENRKRRELRSFYDLLSMNGKSKAPELPDGYLDCWVKISNEFGARIIIHQDGYRKLADFICETDPSAPKSATETEPCHELQAMQSILASLGHNEAPSKIELRGDGHRCCSIPIGPNHTALLLFDTDDLSELNQILHGADSLPMLGASVGSMV